MNENLLKMFASTLEADRELAFEILKSEYPEDFEKHYSKGKDYWHPDDSFLGIVFKNPTFQNTLNLTIRVEEE